jgi:nuclear transport factor 2 (NTF2) superfamily protein
METAEKIVEAYCRYVRGWFTIPNVRCTGQYEADLLAVDVSGKGVRRYHIECGVSISGGYSKLTAKEFSPDRLKQRLEQAGQRRTLGYFTKRKFSRTEVLRKLKEYGFEGNNYTKVIVTWGWEEDALKQAKKAKVELWDFREILKAIAEACRGSRSYFADDTLRTVQLLQRSGGRK